MYTQVATPVGILQIEEAEGYILSVKQVGAQMPETGVVSTGSSAADQLREYFSGQRTRFDLLLNPTGTPFQQRVWDAIRQIPYGQTRSYSQIAAQIGNPGAARAVGMACHKNPIWILIPCHRVVGSNGAVTGYAGGLPMKRFLLELEQTISQAE